MRQTDKMPAGFPRPATRGAANPRTSAAAPI